MAKRKSSKKGVMGPFIGFILLCAAILAFVRGTGVSSFQDVVEVFQGKAPSVEEFVGNLIGSEQPLTWPGGDSGGSSGNSGGSSGGTGGGAGTGKPNVSKASEALASLRISNANKVNYDRNEWGSWDNIRSCWTVREEVLYRQAEPGTLTLLDKNKQPTSDKNSACEISGGEWIDPYTGDRFTNPSDLDIDHVVPLGYAARHGGQDWDSSKKRDFSNSLDEGHLLAVSASANRSKSDKGPSEWQPQRSHQCAYAGNWISVSSKWGLSVTQADHDALKKMLATC